VNTSKTLFMALLIGVGSGLLVARLLKKNPNMKVKQSEERSDELITSALGTKITQARTFVKDAPPTQQPQ